MKFFKEFKEFINKGNVVDMAVGVVIATAFGNITKSLVADVIMPLVGLLTGGVSVSDLKYVLTAAQFDAETGAELVAENAIRYGQFIQYIVDFLIIAFAVFVFVKALNTAKNIRLKKEEEAKAQEPAPAPEPTAQEKLLAEIRDLLKDKQ